MDSLKMILIPESSNVKTGNMIQSYSFRAGARIQKMRNL